jgi:hypothetical protein
MVVTMSDIFRLRHTLSPSIMWIVMLGGVDMLLLYAMISEHAFNWNIIGTIALISSMAIFIVSLNLRYTITWIGNAIVQTAFGLPKTTIKLTDITKIRFEISDTRTLFKANRPYNRVAIYGKNKFVDVSMKHFKIEDIRKLVAAIRRTRPDLPMDKLPKTII